MMNKKNKKEMVRIIILNVSAIFLAIFLLNWHYSKVIPLFSHFIGIEKDVLSILIAPVYLVIIACVLLTGYIDYDFTKKIIKRCKEKKK